MSALPRDLGEFVESLAQDQHLPQRKFLTTALAALFVGHSLQLSKMAAACGTVAKGVSRAREYDSREHYFSRNINSDRLDMSAVLTRYHEAISPLVSKDEGAGVIVAVDGTDYRKEHARPSRPRGMQGATRVRDASRSREKEANLTMGYPGVTVEASLPDGNQIPLAHWLFSRTHADPITGNAFLSDEQVLSDVLKRVAPLVGPKAWWTFDRGYAGHTHFDLFDQLKIRWLVRIQNKGEPAKRRIRTADGIEWQVRELADALPLPYTNSGRSKEGEPLDIRLGVRQVWLRSPDGKWQERARTLVVGEINGSPTRFILLAGEPMQEDAATASLLRRLYRRRWKIEETHRHSKDSQEFGFRTEDFRALKLVAIQRLVFLAMLACGFMALMRARASAWVAELVEAAWAAQKPPRDPRYRLTSMIGRILATWLPKAWKRSRPVRALSAPSGVPPDPRRLRDRYRNAQRAVARAERALRLAGIEG